jgi:hypothetical protein
MLLRRLSEEHIRHVQGRGWDMDTILSLLRSRLFRRRHIVLRIMIAMVDQMSPLVV